VWTDDVLKELGLKKEEFGNDGTFWMSVEDFVFEFRNLYVCRLFGK